MNSQSSASKIFKKLFKSRKYSDRDGRWLYIKLDKRVTKINKKIMLEDLNSFSKKNPRKNQI